MVEQQIQREQATTIPREAYQVAKDYQLGLPLTFHNTRPQVLRLYKVFNLMLLSTAISVFLVGLIAVLVNVYQLQVLKSQYPINVHDALLLQRLVFQTQDALIESSIPLILGVLFGVGIIVRIRIVARKLPGYLLACTDGLLEVRPKKVDVTRWEEVRGLLILPGVAKKKSYLLSRSNRKPLFFGSALEDVEELADLIRQHIQKG